MTTARVVNIVLSAALIVAVVAIMVVAMRPAVVEVVPDPGTTPTDGARVSSVFYVDGNLCPAVMTHAECKERLSK